MFSTCRHACSAKPMVKCVEPLHCLKELELQLLCALTDMLECHPHVLQWMLSEVDLC